jgi:hypothetical protein
VGGQVTQMVSFGSQEVTGVRVVTGVEVEVAGVKVVGGGAVVKQAGMGSIQHGSGTLGSIPSQPSLSMTPLYSSQSQLPGSGGAMVGQLSQPIKQ